MINIYDIIDFDRTIQMGDWDTDMYKYAPEHFEKVAENHFSVDCFSIREKITLYKDPNCDVYYILHTSKRPFGDYCWTTQYLWERTRQEDYPYIKI